MPEVITNNLDLWSSALLTRSTAGRGSNSKLEAYGIKKLRELILELAVRGKLVVQDANDEPARELLTRVIEDNERLLKEKKKKHVDMPKISDEEIIFELPAGWEYVRNGCLFSLRKGKKPKNLSDSPIGLPYLDIEALDRDNVLRFTDDEKCTLAAEEDILVVCDGSRSGLVLDGKSGVVGSTLAVIDTPKYIQPFVRLLFKESYERLNSTMKGAAIPHLDTNRLVHQIVGLPPLAEQHRIVAKVYELMALCDQLEQQQTGSLVAHQTLVEALLGMLTRVESQQEFSAAWARIANHFDTLFTTEASIDQLKQTILQLAVMGKLVPQEPTDEPSSSLLARIAEQKKRMVEIGEIRKQKPLPTIGEEEKVFVLPNGWEWCRLQEIVYLLGDGLHGTPEYTPDERFYFVNGNNLSNGEIVIKPDTKAVAKDQYEKYKKPLGDNSVLVSINGTLGSVAFYDNEEIILGKSACFFNLAEDIYKRFVKVLIDAPGFKNYAYTKATGSTIKNLGLSAMNSFPIALPPKEEQHRIVAKVDELMALCDTIKARLADARAIQLHLADAIVEQAVA